MLSQIIISKIKRGWALFPIFCSITALLLLFLGRFWWPFGSNAAWSAAIRSFLVFGFLASFFRMSFWKTDKTGWVFLAFLGILFLNGYFIEKSPQMIRRLLIILIFIKVAATTLKSFVAFRNLIIILALTGSVFASLSVLINFFHGDLTFAYRQSPIQGSGIKGFAEFRNTIEAGLNYVPSLIAALWMASSSSRKFTTIRWVFCAIPIVVFIYFTYARTSWLSGIFSCLLLVVLTTNSHFRKMILSGIIIMAILVWIFGNNAVYYELFERNITGREEIWKVLFEQMSGYWMTGHGLDARIGPILIHGGSQLIDSHPHNLYLEVLYKYGMTALVPMLIASAFLVLGLFRLRAQKMASFWLSLLSGGLLAMLFDTHDFIGSPNLVWIYFWLPASAYLAIAPLRPTADTRTTLSRNPV